jgi:serine/threonine protein kinase
VTAGSKLGPYQIVSPVGRGGMGEVWKAIDPRLNREVAIKISAEQFTDRFEREAQAIAALNHPNICTLFDVGPNYLVMELIEGPTLADRVAEGPIPLEEALAIAKQIADALEAAHEKNIVHRDLKPGNIKVRPDGSVKVLDFGLAKSGLTNVEVSHDSPTLLHSPTIAGVILGTAAYMAPEQARGKIVDKRADIWSFGVVLHEMLTGKRTFEGEDLTDTLASVVKTDPDLTVIPHKVRRLLAKCLQKDPKKRLRDIGDAWDYLDEAQPATPRPEPMPAKQSRLWPAVAGILALALAALGLRDFYKTPPAQPSVTLQLQATSTFVDLSPDSRTLAWVAPNGDTPQIWVRSLSSTESHPLAGTDGASYPFWSPDGAWIAFFSQGKLRKIPVTGGPVQVLCDAADGRGGTWNKDGVIVFSPSPLGALLRISDQGGTPAVVLNVGTETSGYRFPSFLPDGKHFLFDRETGLSVGSLDGGQPVHLLPDPVKAVFVPETPGASQGYLLFTRQNTLIAQGFDSRALTVHGNPVSVAPEVGNGANAGFGLFTATQSSLVYLSSVGAGALHELAWVDRTGKRLSVAGKANRYQTFSLSQDSRFAALTIGDVSSTGEVWILDLIRGTQERFAFGPRLMSNAIWGAGGNSLIWTVRGQPWELHRRSLTGGPEEVLATGLNISASDLSPDGKWLIYAMEGRDTGLDLWEVPLDGDRKPRLVIRSPSRDDLAAFSPDGKWIAWQSAESGRSEVYLQPFPGPGARVQVSTSGGSRPKWRRDGKELFYISHAKLIGIPFEPGAEVRLGTPQSLFRIRVPLATYSPSSDGQRFLLLDTVGGEETPPPQLTVVLNWQSGLKE